MMSPEVIIVAKRLVVLATVAKKVVEVELVVVELSPVKFWRVDEANVRNPPFRYDRPDTVITVEEA